jgi:hypothetical protein
MTPIEFSAWLNGINAGLCGALPHRTIWAMVLQEAAKLAAPPGAKLPAQDLWWDRHINPSPTVPTPLQPPWVVTCDTKGHTNLSQGVHK